MMWLWKWFYLGVFITVVFVLVFSIYLVRAETIHWSYDPAKEVPITATVERAQDKDGQYWPVVTLPGATTEYTDATVPADWPSVFYRVRTEGGYSRTVGGLRIEYFNTQLGLLRQRVGALERQLEGVCAAAKKMGGTAASLAGRLRTEIPCF